MPRKVLLISANRCTVPEPVFPLGLAYINAALRHAGYETQWVDCCANGESIDQTLIRFRPDFVGISLRNIDDIAFRTRSTYFEGLTSICQTVRRVHPCPVVLGGSGFTLFPERLLAESGAEFGVQGEGEASLVSLLEALQSGREYAHIPGLVYRRGPEIISNPVRVTRAEILLGAADRPSELVAHYLRAGGMLNVQTQRGCPHVCCYCTYPLIEGRACRRRRPEAVAEEMAQLQAQGARYLFIVDSVFNSTPEHVTETCQAILERRLAVRWGCFLRPEGLTRDLMKLMAEAGLQHIEFGSDSFCDSVLAAYGKQFTFDDILHSTALAQQAGLDFAHYLICGGPGENLQTLQTSFENSLRLPGAVILAVVGMRVYPRTRVFERAVQEGRIDSKSDLLQPVYDLAPGLSADDVFARLHDFSSRSPNWIAGDPRPGYERLVARLRQRGVVGPLWSYLAALQRLTPVASG